MLSDKLLANVIFKIRMPNGTGTDYRSCQVPRQILSDSVLQGP
jgi:hypothetical protein